MIAIDVRRRQEQRYDIICCVKGLDTVRCSSYSVYPLINKPSKCADKESAQISKLCMCRFCNVAEKSENPRWRTFCWLMTSRKPAIDVIVITSPPVFKTECLYFLIVIRETLNVKSVYRACETLGVRAFEYTCMQCLERSDEAF